MISIVPPKMVTALWPQIGPLVAQALRRVKNDCYLPDDIWMACRDGRMVAFIDYEGDTINGVAITEIHALPRKRICNIPFVAGRNMKQWVKPMLDVITEYARESACDRLAGGGRKGWIRAAGFKEDGILVTKELTNG